MKHDDCVKQSDCSGPLFGYLGHFREAKFIKMGHNDSGTVQITPKDQDTRKQIENSFNNAFPLNAQTQPVVKPEPKKKPPPVDS